MVTDPVTPIMSIKLAIGGGVTGSDPGEPLSPWVDGTVSSYPGAGLKVMGKIQPVTAEP